MAKKIMEEGARIDKSRAAIVQAIEACKRQEKLLTRQGVQSGACHFKTERKNPTMYVLEPVKDGHRKYVHVGTDPDKQADMKARLRRWALRDALQKDIQRLERELKALDWRIEGTALEARSLEKRAESIRDSHLKQET
jgi:hypothetical protein